MAVRLVEGGQHAVRVGHVEATLRGVRAAERRVRDGDRPLRDAAIPGEGEQPPVVRGEEHAVADDRDLQDGARGMELPADDRVAGRTLEPDSRAVGVASEADQSAASAGTGRFEQDARADGKRASPARRRAIRAA